jgi:hypothetical protein
MATTNKYAAALAAFNTAKAKLYNRASTWPEYAQAVAESDQAWLALAVAANAAEVEARSERREDTNV